MKHFINSIHFPDRKTVWLAFLFTIVMMAGISAVIFGVESIVNYMILS